MNTLDAAVTILGLIEMLFTSSSALVAFRAVRFFRLFRLVRYMKSLQTIVMVIASSFLSIFYATLLLLLFSFIFTIFGMQFFGGKFDFPGDEELPRNNFDDVHHSFIAVFQILAGENWPAIMYDGVRSSGWIGVPYFIAWVVLGQFILLNLFLAVLMDNFDKIGKDADGKIARENRRKAKMLAKKQEAKHAKRLKKFKKIAKKRANALSKSIMKSEKQITRQEQYVHKLRVLMQTHRAQEHEVDSALKCLEEEKERLAVLKATTPPTPAALMREDDTKRKGTNAKICCFSENFFLVAFSRKMIRHPWFDRFILALIIISSMLMAIDGPETEENKNLSLGLFIIDVVFTILFTIEVILKIQALGIVCHPTAYMRDAWNILDFVIVAASLANLSMEAITRLQLTEFGSKLGFLKILRLLRILRPLRMINRNPNMKLVVNALLLSVK